MACKVHRKQCLQVLVHEGKADTSVVRDVYLLRSLTRETTMVNFRKTNVNHTGNLVPLVTFPSLQKKSIQIPQNLLSEKQLIRENSVNLNTGFYRGGERWYCKRKNRKHRKRNPLYEYLLVNSQRSRDFQRDTQTQEWEKKTSKKLAEFPQGRIDPWAPRPLKSSEAKLEKSVAGPNRPDALTPSAERARWLTRSDSRLYIPKETTTNILEPIKHKNTEKLLQQRIHKTLSENTETPSTQVNTIAQPGVSSLNKFRPLPPIFVNSTSASCKSVSPSLPPSE